jgi:uridine kinase
LGHTKEHDLECPFFNPRKEASPGNELGGPRKPERSPEFTAIIKQMTILIGGGSCSGKSTLTKALAERLYATPINLDKFFRRDEPNAPMIEVNGQLLFDCNHPQTINLQNALKEINQTPESRIIEGHFALTYPELRKLATLKIFVDCPAEIRQERRLARDTANQKGTPEQILAYYQTSAVNGYIAYIEPSKSHADLVINGQLSPDENIHIIQNFIENMSFM